MILYGFTERLEGAEEERLLYLGRQGGPFSRESINKVCSQEIRPSIQMIEEENLTMAGVNRNII